MVKLGKGAMSKKSKSATVLPPGKKLLKPRSAFSKLPIPFSGSCSELFDDESPSHPIADITSYSCATNTTDSFPTGFAISPQAAQPDVAPPTRPITNVEAGDALAT